MKVLFVASIVGHINAFHLPYLEMFKENGYETHVAAKGERELPFVDVLHNIPFERSPFNKQNILAYKKLKKLIDSNDYDMIHCHTPVASVLTRIAARKARKKGTKVIYTAHGFHFFKGAPVKNWLMYYPMEKLCARMADVIITINKEDFAIAKKRLKAKRIELVHGVGINLERFVANKLTAEEKKEMRKSFGIPEEGRMLLSVGEVNNNKNHIAILKALTKLPENVHYCVAGRDFIGEKLLAFAKEVGVDERFHLLGRRNDIPDVLNCADIFCFPSKREGLGMAALEAMACGLPLVTSNIHGINDYSEDGVTGYKCSPTDTDAFAEKIKALLDNPELCKKMGETNREAVKKYDVRGVTARVWQIYSEELNVKN